MIGLLTVSPPWCALMRMVSCMVCICGARAIQTMKRAVFVVTLASMAVGIEDTDLT